MVEFLLSVDWGVALLMLAGAYFLATVIAAICWFKTDINTELIVFFCVVSLIMAPIMSVAWGAYGSTAWSCAVPMATTSEKVKKEDVYDIPKTPEYEVSLKRKKNNG